MEWLFVLSVFLAAYIAIVTKQIQSGILDEWMFEIKIAPVILVLMFGVNIQFLVNRPNSLSLTLFISGLRRIHGSVQSVHVQ